MAAQGPLPGKLGEIQRTVEQETAEMKKIEQGKFTHPVERFI